MGIPRTPFEFAHPREALQTLLRTISDGAAVFDDHGDVIAANELGEKVLADIDNEPSDDDWDPAGFFDGVTMEPLGREGRPEIQALSGEPIEEMRVLVRNDTFDEGEVFSITARPILSEGTIVGAMAIYRDVSSEAWAEEELRSANSRLESYVGKLEETATELAQMTEMGDFLQSCITYSEFYEILGMFGKRIFQKEAGGVYLLSDDRTTVERVADWGDGVISETSFLPDECWALRRGRHHQALGQGESPRCRHLLPDSDDEYLCVPMMAQGQALGILHLKINTKAPAGAGPGESPNFGARKRTITSVAEQIAGSLANLTLRETLSQQANKDPLTRLYNRRYLQQWLKRETANSKQRGMPLAVAMLDLDHFKKCNDTYGHAAADEVLKGVSSVCRRAVNGKGIAARFGGEEIVIALRDTSLEEARLVAEQIRVDIRALEVVFAGRRLAQNTGSFGVTALAPGEADPESLLQRADKALYRAKDHGRDRVEIAEATEGLDNAA